MPNRKDYGQDLFKQVQELISKCDNLSHELKKERKERQKEKEQFNEKINKLENKIVKLEEENKKLRDDNDRLKKIVNNNSDSLEYISSSVSEKESSNKDDRETIEEINDMPSVSNFDKNLVAWKLFDCLSKFRYLN